MADAGLRGNDAAAAIRRAFSGDRPEALIESVAG